MQGELVFETTGGRHPGKAGRAFSARNTPGRPSLGLGGVRRVGAPPNAVSIVANRGREEKFTSSAGGRSMWGRSLTAARPGGPIRPICKLPI